MSVVFGLAAAQGFRQSDGALDRAEANAAQVVRIQAIHTNLVSANADATNAFLVGGLEPPDQRQHFVDSMAQRPRLISEAAIAQPADQEALGALNTDPGHLRRPDRASPGEQPPGPPDRIAVPEGRERRTAERLAARW